MRAISISLFISVCAHLCAAQNTFDLSSITDAETRACWEQLFTDVNQVDEEKAEEMYSIFFGKQYAGMNRRQKSVMDSVKMFLFEYTGYCLKNSGIVTLYPNPNRGHFNISGKLPTGNYTIEIINEKGHKIYSQESSLKDGKLNSLIELDMTDGLYFLVISGIQFRQVIIFLKQ